MSTAKIGALGSYSLNGGFRIDGSVTEFWARKTEAVEAAKSIGWPRKSVQPVYTRFQKGYGLSWGIAREGRVALVSRAEWIELTKHLGGVKEASNDGQTNGEKRDPSTVRGAPGGDEGQG